MIRCSYRATQGIPDNWSAVQITDIAKKISVGGKLGLTKSNNYCDEGFPAYSAAGQDGYVAEFEYDQNAVIVSSIGARCGKCFYATGKWTSLANIQLIFTDEEQCNSRFLWYLINDESFWHRSGTAQPFIKPSDIHHAWIPLPPIHEQSAIVDFLDTLYRPAIHHQKLIELNTTLYNGMLQRLSSGTKVGEIQRFKLKDISSLCMGETLIKKNLSASGVPVYSANTEEGPWGFTQKNRKRFPNGTIVLSARGSIGFPRLPPFELFTSTQTTIAIQPNQRIVEPAFLRCFLQTVDFKLLTTVQAVPMLTIADMKEVYILLPNLKKQRELVHVFDTVYKTIGHHKNLVFQQRQLHKGIQKKLLYGERKIKVC